MDSINMKDRENKRMNEDVITSLEKIKEHPELSTSKEAQNLLDYNISARKPHPTLAGCGMNRENS